jgi:hypothetical protein
MTIGESPGRYDVTRASAPPGSAEAWMPCGDEHEAHRHHDGVEVLAPADQALLDPQNPYIEPGETVDPTPSSTRLLPRLLYSPSDTSIPPPSVIMTFPDGIGNESKEDP